MVGKRRTLAAVCDGFATAGEPLRSDQKKMPIREGSAQTPETGAAQYFGWLLKK
jgi:hypothetical protein